MQPTPFYVQYKKGREHTTRDAPNHVRAEREAKALASTLNVDVMIMARRGVCLGPNGFEWRDERLARVTPDGETQFVSKSDVLRPSEAAFR